MITNQFPDFKHTNFQISTPTPFEVYLLTRNKTTLFPFALQPINNDIRRQKTIIILLKVIFQASRTIKKVLLIYAHQSRPWLHDFGRMGMGENGVAPRTPSPTFLNYKYIFYSFIVNCPRLQLCQELEGALARSYGATQGQYIHDIRVHEI